MICCESKERLTLHGLNAHQHKGSYLWRRSRDPAPFTLFLNDSYTTLATTRLVQSLKVSLVIPAFGRMASLRAVLQSSLHSASDMEVILVDDKSPEGSSILKLAREYGAAYIRNESKAMESQRALCCNLGFEMSTGEVIVFNDADTLLAANALESHVRYHVQVPNAAVCSQFWSIAYNKTALDALKEPDVNALRTLGHSLIHDADLSWSETSDPHPSSNWWAFLGGQSSFNRRDFERVGRWDEKYTGWGVEDNDLGYRIYKGGMQILYASDIRAFHIDHPMTHEDYAQKCRTALRNLKYMCKKYPEIEKEERVTQRLKELETLSESELKNVTRQGTAGGGPISDFA